MSAITDGELFDADWSVVRKNLRMFDYRRLITVHKLMAELRRVK